MDRAHYWIRSFAGPRTALARNRGGLINQTNILLCVIFAVMFARAFTALGAPSIINFAHLGLAPCLAFFVLISRPSRAAKKMVRGLLALLAVIVLSAFANEAGPVNAILEFLVLGEPFFFFIAILSRPWLLADIKRFRLWLLLLALFHACLALVQWLADWAPAAVVVSGGDRIQGLFLGQGAGHHVGGAVALTAALYFSSDSPMKSVFARVAAALTFALIAIISDSKTVIAAFMVAIALTVVFFLRKFRVFFKYTIQATAVLLIGVLALSFTSLKLRDRVSQIDVGIPHKSYVFTVISSYHESSINAFIGLGPGHTGSRVANMIPSYYDLLRPLGVTTSPVTQRIEEENLANPLSHPWTGSSVWALNYAWASVWGDLGYLGLVTYLLLWQRVWQIACVEYHTRVMWIAAMILGSMFTYLEEPGYTVYLISLLGLSVQQRHSRRWFQLLDATPNPEQINPRAKLRYH